MVLTAPSSSETRLRLPAPPTPVAVLGFGAASPEHTLTAAELGAPFGRTDSWIHTRTGIATVRRLGPDESAHDLAVAAAADALRRARLAPADIDLVLIATCSVGHEAAAGIAADVAPRAGSMVVNSACSGFCFALASAGQFVSTGTAGTVLVLAVEQMSSLLDPEDLGTSIIFGDGAGAAVVGRSANGSVGIGPLVSGSDGLHRDLIACDDTGKLRMAGREVFRWAVETMPAVASAACARAGIGIEDVDVFVPHQANARIIDAIVDRLGLTDVVVAHDIAVSGNTSAASIPIALTRLLERDEAPAGATALLLGFGAGLSYAGQVVRVPATPPCPA